MGQQHSKTTFCCQTQGSPKRSAKEVAHDAVEKTDTFFVETLPEKTKEAADKTKAGVEHAWAKTKAFFEPNVESAARY